MPNQFSYQAPRVNYFLEQLLKQNNYLDNNNSNPHLSFLCYPGEDLLIAYKSKVSKTDLRGTEGLTEIFIGQIPNSFSDVLMVWALESLLGKDVIVNYYSGRNISRKSSNCGFLTINQKDKEALLKLNNAIWADTNGIWIAKDQVGIEIFNKLEVKIKENRNIFEDLGTKYGFSGFLSPHSIVIETTNQKAKKVKPIVENSNKSSKNKNPYRHQYPAKQCVPNQSPITTTRQNNQQYLDPNQQTLTAHYPYPAPYQTLAYQNYMDVQFLPFGQFVRCHSFQQQTSSSDLRIRQNNPYKF